MYVSLTLVLLALVFVVIMSAVVPAFIVWRDRRQRDACLDEAAANVTYAYLVWADVRDMYEGRPPHRVDPLDDDDIPTVVLPPSLTRAQRYRGDHGTDREGNRHHDH